MELKELTDKTLALFHVESPDRLGAALMSASDDDLDRFAELVGGDFSVDWMQMIYQYYLADRREKKQDYTPASLARLLSGLVGDDVIIDMCAGSGALTIQAWLDRPDTLFVCYELDDTVIPFLLFNLRIRNISAVVHQGDVLAEEVTASWKVTKRARYGHITSI